MVPCTSLLSPNAEDDVDDVDDVDKCNRLVWYRIRWTWRISLMLLRDGDKNVLLEMDETLFTARGWKDITRGRNIHDDVDIIMVV